MTNDHDQQHARQHQGEGPSEEQQQAQPEAAAANDAGAAQATEAAAPPEPTPEEVAAELRDRLLRNLAEMENLRQRTAREVDEARKYAVTGFARDLLDVSDNLGRALAAVPAEAREADGPLKNFVLGVDMTLRSLHGAFEKHKIGRVEPKRGDRFDPKVHQAMFEVPTSELPPGAVAEVMQAGYVLADRLLRPALVGVAKAATAGAAAGATKVDTTA